MNPAAAHTDAALHPASTMATNAAGMARYDDAMAGVLPGYFDIVADHGEGIWLFDVEGNRYLDLTAGIAVATTGHCHPRVVAAVEAQARRLLHTSVVTRNAPAVALAERIGARTPFLDQPQVFFCNSGAEAVEGGLKLARRVTGRPGIVAFEGAFHGRTLGATSVTTAKQHYREGYGPLVPEVLIAPYGNVPDALEALDALLDARTDAEDRSTIACMLVEPVLGEGGYVVPPVAWLEGLRQRCDRLGALLIFDEVQCGVGRTGRFFAAERFGVRPDVVLFAKGIASGLPLGGLVASRALLEQWPVGAHGSTFGGNPVSCAAGLATIEVIDEEHLCDRAERLGEIGIGRLRAAGAADPRLVREVRGIGLMIGIELASGDDAARVQQRCFAEGVLVLNCGPHGEVLRLCPALTITDAEWDHGLRVLTAALAD